VALEDEVKEFSVHQKTELEGAADQIFEDKLTQEGLSSIDMRTNLTVEELPLCLVNDLVFNIVGCPELSPTRQFKRLASSRNGWKTEKFVQTAQGSNDMKTGTGFMDKMGNLFKRKE